MRPQPCLLKQGAYVRNWGESCMHQCTHADIHMFVCVRARTGYSGRKLCRHSLILAWGLLGQPLRTHTSMCVSLMMRVSVAASRLFTHTQTHHKEDEAPRQHSA